MPLTRTTRRFWGAIFVGAAVIFGFVTLFYAITETQRQEEVIAAMDEEAKAWNAFLDSLNYGVAILDHNARVKSWNPALARWTGYTAEEVIGHDIAMLMSEESAEAHSRNYAEAIRERLAANQVQVVDCQIVPKEGEPIDVRVHVYVVRSKLTGRKPYAIAMVNRREKLVDITEGKK